MITIISVLLTVIAYHYMQNTLLKCIAGCACKHISKRLSCETCKDALLAEYSKSLLLLRKLRGKLFMASQDAVTVCKIAERCFRSYESDLGVFKGHVLDSLCNRAMHELVSTDVFSILKCHMFDSEPSDNHVIGLIKFIVRQFMVIRLHHAVTERIESMQCPFEIT